MRIDPQHRRILMNLSGGREPMPNEPNGERGVPRWNPGDFGTLELEQMLMDVLADLWRDNWRQGQPEAAQLRNWRRQVESAMFCATSLDLEIIRRGEVTRHGLTAEGR